MLIVTNPTAGTGPRTTRSASWSTACDDWISAAELVTDLDSLAELASRYQAAGELRAIVAAGGDGTVAEIVNRTAARRADHRLSAGHRQPAGQLPATSTRDPAALAQTIVEGATMRLDAGSANGRIFLLMAGCGFDADVVAAPAPATHGGGTSPIGPTPGRFCESIRSYRYPDLRVYCEPATGGEWIRDRCVGAVGVCGQPAVLRRRAATGARRRRHRRPARRVHVSQRLVVARAAILGLRGHSAARGRLADYRLGAR